jgi:hypothetical protein
MNDGNILRALHQAGSREAETHERELEMPAHILRDVDGAVRSRSEIGAGSDAALADFDDVGNLRAVCAAGPERCLYADG